MKKSNVKGDTTSSRQKISNTLKEKWKDPAFRQKMMESMKDRKSPSSTASKAQRAKISEAMKKKWQDAEYRRKAMKGMEKYREGLPPRPVRTTTPKKKVDGIMAVTPITNSSVKLKKRAVQKSVKVSSATAGVKKVKKKKAAKKRMNSKESRVTLASTAQKKDGPNPVRELDVKTLSDDGDISRMREERRDLYDLLYGDEGDDHTENDLSDDDIEEAGPGVLDLDLLGKEVFDEPITDEPKGLSSFFTGTADLDDEDLDDFDPYNLDDY